MIKKEDVSAFDGVGTYEDVVDIILFDPEVSAAISFIGETFPNVPIAFIRAVSAMSSCDNVELRMEATLNCFSLMNEVFSDADARASVDKSIVELFTEIENMKLGEQDD